MGMCFLGVEVLGHPDTDLFSWVGTILSNQFGDITSQFRKNSPSELGGKTPL
jgi:hypothetical protein